MVTTSDAVKLAADAIVALMTATVDGPLNKFGSLLLIAHRLECDVVAAPGIAPSYALSEDDEFCGLIALRMDTADSMVRQLAHELGHHIVKWWDRWATGITPRTREALMDCCENHYMQEEMCRMIADMVSAIPGGLQWDGRLAIPRGEPVLRFYKRRTAPAFMEMSEDEIAALEVASQYWRYE
jgi:hypothetical protein